MEKLTKINKELLDFLARTDQDREEFEKNFWQGEDRQFFSVSSYRLHKINKRNLSLGEFVILFEINPTYALRELFQQPINASDASVIVNKIKKGELTARRIYDKFIDEDKQLNITRLLHKRGSW